VKDYTYCLYLDTPEGREEILIGEKDPNRVRRVATGKRFTKRINKGRAVITRDNKVLPGGAYALDQICFDKWLEDSNTVCAGCRAVLSLNTDPSGEKEDNE